MIQYFDKDYDAMDHLVACDNIVDEFLMSPDFKTF